jgi:hypothetical protein
MNMPWVESPFFESLIDQRGLTPEQQQMARDFSRQGYLAFDLELSDFDQLSSTLIVELEPLYLGERRLQDAWQHNDLSRKLATLPRVLSILEMLYGRRPIPFQTLNFPVGTQQAGHTDTIHFHSMPHRFMCGVWVALEDIDADNGPLFYYPGSHKLPIYDFFDISSARATADERASDGEYYAYDDYVNFLDRLMQEHRLERTELKIKKGQALIWAANLVHGGAPILDPNRTRNSQVSHYYFENCAYFTPMLTNQFTGDVFLRDITDISTGQKVENRYNGETLRVGYNIGPPRPSLGTRIVRKLGRMLRTG